MAKVALSVQTVYADLLDRCFDGMFQTEFPPSGSFVQVPVKDKIYWYHQPGAADEQGRRKRKYVGPDSPELRQQIEAFGKEKLLFKEQRSLVSMLKQAGLAGPPYEGGEILAALARSGVFRLRACLVGTMAFQAYGGLLGERLPSMAVMTNDIDVAQFSEISIAIAEEEMTAPTLHVLQAVDPSFRAVNDAHDPRHHIAYINDDMYRVELLVPNRGADLDEPIALPALQAQGQPLRYLDYLIYDAIPAVVLHDTGVLVNVPQPQRYALHKLIVSQVRRETTEVNKDLQQAEILIQVLASRRRRDLRAAWQELSDRGPKWRQHAIGGLQSIAPAVREQFEAAIGETIAAP